MVLVLKIVGIVDGDSCVIWDFLMLEIEVKCLVVFVLIEMRIYLFGLCDFVLLVW